MRAPKIEIPQQKKSNFEQVIVSFFSSFSLSLFYTLSLSFLSNRGRKTAPYERTRAGSSTNQRMDVPFALLAAVKKVFLGSSLEEGRGGEEVSALLFLSPLPPALSLPLPSHPPPSSPPFLPPPITTTPSQHPLNRCRRQHAPVKGGMTTPKYEKVRESMNKKTSHLLFAAGSSPSLGPSAAASLMMGATSGVYTSTGHLLCVVPRVFAEECRDARVRCYGCNSECTSRRWILRFPSLSAPSIPFAFSCDQLSFFRCPFVGGVPVLRRCASFRVYGYD